MVEFKDSIIQSLNRKVGGVCLPVGPFEANASLWEGISVVFAKLHPEPAAFKANPAQELARIGGRIVGKVTFPRVVKTGTPRLVANVSVDDPEALLLYNMGRLSLSTGLQAKVASGRVVGDVAPNHILVFETTEYHQPKDLGVLLNGPTSILSGDVRSFDHTVGSWNPYTEEWSAW